jgi:hypothetical protein
MFGADLYKINNKERKMQQGRVERGELRGIINVILKNNCQRATSIVARRLNW